MSLLWICRLPDISQRQKWITTFDENTFYYRLTIVDIRGILTQLSGKVKAHSVAGWHKVNLDQKYDHWEFDRVSPQIWSQGAWN